MLEEQEIVSRLDRPLVERAAALQGTTMSDFVASAARAAAEATIARHSLVKLSVDEQTRFAAALLDPPPIAGALKRAIANRDHMFDAS